MRVELCKIESIKPYEFNPRKNDAAVEAVAHSIREFGFRQPIVVDPENVIVIGHTRYRAAQKLGHEDVPVHVVEGLTETQVRALRVADNKTHELSEWDAELLPAELQSLLDESFDIESIGFSADDIDSILMDTGVDPTTKLSDRFLVPPFSVLDARQGYWQERKDEWLALGIESEIGRLEDGKGKPTFTPSTQPTRVLDEKASYEKKTGRKVSWEEYYDANPEAYRMSGTSIFDPVLSELAVRWFSPPGGTVLDPFAGGSVRGIVASRLGRRYVGIELRKEQIEANLAQAERICTGTMPEWIEGDSREIQKLASGVEADLVFSCPPYADLEQYSNDPRDLSTMEYDKFRRAYSEIINAACGLLKVNRFACFVTGDVRDKAGFYYGFPMHTVEAFQAAGLRFYNDAVLITPIGSLPMRAAKYFSHSRKLGKAHQNVQVFAKGSPEEATVDLGEVELSMAADI